MYLFKYECRLLVMHISDEDDAPVARAHVVGATTQFNREGRRRKNETYPTFFPWSTSCFPHPASATSTENLHEHHADDSGVCVKRVSC